MGDVAGRDGLRLGDAVLAQAARPAGGGRLGGPAPGAAGAPARGGADRLAPNGLGIAFVLAQAAVVLGFAVAQWIGLRHATHVAPPAYA